MCERAGPYLQDHRTLALNLILERRRAALQPLDLDILGGHVLLRLGEEPPDLLVPVVLHLQLGLCGCGPHRLELQLLRRRLELGLRRPSGFLNSARQKYRRRTTSFGRTRQCQLHAGEALGGVALAACLAAMQYPSLTSVVLAAAW